jgi:hypothetical protein
VFLSHQQTIGTTPTACIRFTVLSRIEILHILLEHPYDSQRNKNAGLSSPTSSATASREKPGSVQSAPTFQRRLAVVGSVAHLVAKDPGGLPRLRRSWQGPPRGTGRKPYPRCLASGSSDRTVRQWVGHRPSGRLPADQPHRYCRPGGVQARQNSRRGRWDKSVLLWDVATHLARAVLVQPIFELVLRAALT